MPASAVLDMGIYPDADISVWTHVMRTVSSCFAVLRQLRSARRSVSRPVLLVYTRIEYGNAVLAGHFALSFAVLPERCSASNPFYTAASARLATSQESSLVQRS